MKLLAMDTGVHRVVRSHALGEESPSFHLTQLSRELDLRLLFKNSEQRMVLDLLRAWADGGEVEITFRVVT